jgi:hypothetical protein
MKIRAEEPSCSTRREGQTDRQETTKLIVDFRNFATVPKKGSSITVLPSDHLCQKWQIAGMTVRKRWQIYAKCNKRQLLECLKKTVTCNEGKSNTLSPDTPFWSPRKLDTFETALSIAVTHLQEMKPTASETAKLTCGRFSSTPALLKSSALTPTHCQMTPRHWYRLCSLVVYISLF